MRVAVLALALGLVGSIARAQAGDPDAGVDGGAPSSAAASGTSSAGTSAGTSSTGTSSTSTSSTSAPSAGASSPRATSSSTRRTTSATPPREQVLADDSDPDEEDEDEDSWGVFYLQALGGYSFANVVQFSQENFVPEATELSGSGLFGGVGAGFRIYWITLGAQATLASYFGFELGTVGLDVGLHLPIPVVQPYLRVGIGYAWMGDADYSAPMLSRTDVYGYAIDAGLGLDIKLARFLSLGAGFDAAFLNMTRQALTDGNVAGVDIQEDGDAVGLQIRLHAQLTFHI
ncbi:MAG: porin family protein [Myxococcota bacterium]|jgi:hypothetical protein|nr:porin family protein [Myxococcota bacterium]